MGSHNQLCKGTRVLRSAITISRFFHWILLDILETLKTRSFTGTPRCWSNLCPPSRTNNHTSRHGSVEFPWTTSCPPTWNTRPNLSVHLRPTPPANRLIIFPRMMPRTTVKVLGKRKTMVHHSSPNHLPRLQHHRGPFEECHSASKVLRPRRPTS